jgi:uncharacterized Tic20 family protein
MGRYQPTDAYALAPVDGSERAAAAIAHAACFLGMPFVLPLAIWLLFPLVQPSAYVRQQAVQAMLFHLVTLVITTIFGTLVVVGFFASLFGSLIAVGSPAHSIFQWLHASWPITIAGTLAFGAFWLWTLVVMVIGSTLSPPSSTIGRNARAAPWWRSAICSRIVCSCSVESDLSVDSA